MLFDTHAHMDDRAFDADRAELLTVEGVGNFKADKYGEAFLAEIAAFAEEA